MKQETSKDRFNRLELTKAEKSTKGSKFYKFTPCEGTLVNTKDNEGQNTQELLNYRINKAERIVSSTKIGNDKSLKVKPFRSKRYQPQLLTVLLVMRMSKEQRKNAKFDRYHAFKPVKKI